MINGNVMTASGKILADNLEGIEIQDEDVIRPINKPLMERAGFCVLKGNLFDAAIMKTSVISESFRKKFLENKASKCARIFWLRKV